MDTFIKKYFGLFDSDNRQALLDLYYEQATFSYTVHRYDSRPRQKSFDLSMMSESRNLLRIRNEQRDKLLRKGRAQVVAALSNLPQTEHLYESFKVDVPMVQQNLMIININGLYRNKNFNYLKAFSRSFFIIANAQTYSIVNDMLSITTPTAELLAFAKSLGKNDPNQMESIEESMNESDPPMGQPMGQSMVNPMVNSMHQPMINQMNPMGVLNQPTQMNAQMNLMNSDLLNPINPSSSGMPPAMGLNSLAQQEELVRRFAEVTGMNLGFSKQCLAENDFDPEKAMTVFKQLNDKGLLPAEAFKK